MDDLLIPLSNGWVCEKQRDGSAPGGYLTTYWSPEVSARCTNGYIKILYNS